jgi:hypothetical protein
MHNGVFKCSLNVGNYAFEFAKWSHIGPRQVSKIQLWLLIFIKIFIKRLTYVYFYEIILQDKSQIYSCNFHISKLNDLKVIHDLYS